MESAVFRIIIILVFSAMFITTHQSLIDWDGNSLCPRTLSRQISQLVPYTETYRKFWRRRTRTNYRIEYRTEWYTVEACCAGYLEESGDCRPICNAGSGCPHGLCIHPDVCSCDVGYKLTSNGHEQMCIPECSNCAYGTCTAPNVCTCNDGFEKSETGECIPSCKPHCPALSQCHENNQCICESGYQLITKPNDDTSLHCEPECNPPCGIRGDCISPNTCSCEIGWKLKTTVGSNFTSTYCEPSCEASPCGKFSICTKPNYCECHMGYKKIADDNSSVTNCAPVCDKNCVNGQCDGPNICKCNDGYILDTSDPFNCEPDCGLPGCFYSTCVAPGMCQCNEGYRETAIPSVCDPVCDKCDNGMCLTPGQCLCIFGYMKNETDHCAPTCDGKCINGVCGDSPNVCKCNDGHVLDTSDPFKCNPVCEICDNGACLSPGECVCNDGYVKNETGNCVPVCKSTCVNGIVCTDRPNTCQCNVGYSLDPTDPLKCDPVCNKCENGSCISPGRCDCNPGFTSVNTSEGETCYQDTHDETTITNPENQTTSTYSDPCSLECGNGLCNFDNQTCQCFFGWSGKYCDATTLCGIIRTENHLDFQQWIADRNETNYTVGNLEAVNWLGPMCSEMCSLGHVNNTNECFRQSTDEERYDNITSIICFISASSTCNAANLSSSNNSAASGIAVGTIVIVIIGIIATASAIFLFVKRNRVLDYKNNPQLVSSYPINPDNLLEQSDFTDSLLHSDESSYL